MIEREYQIQVSRRGKETDPPLLHIKRRTLPTRSLLLLSRLVLHTLLQRLHSLQALLTRLPDTLRKASHLDTRDPLDGLRTVPERTMLLARNNLRLSSNRNARFTRTPFLDDARTGRLPAGQQATLQLPEMANFTPNRGSQRRTRAETSIRKHLRPFQNIKSDGVCEVKHAPNVLLERSLDGVPEAAHKHRLEYRCDDGVVGLLDVELDIVGQPNIYTFNLEEAPVAFAFGQTLFGIWDEPKLEVDVETLSGKIELHDAGKFVGADGRCIVLVKEGDVFEREPDSLEMDVSKTPKRSLCRSTGLAGRRDFNVCDVAQVCMARKKIEGGDVKILEDEFDIAVNILGPVTPSGYAIRFLICGRLT